MHARAMRVSLAVRSAAGFAGLALVTGCEHESAPPPKYAVWTWGANDFGQIGDGTRSAQRPPVRLGLDDIVEVRAGLGFTLARARDGRLWEWGSERKQISGDTPCPDPQQPQS